MKPDAALDAALMSRSSISPRCEREDAMPLS